MTDWAAYMREYKANLAESDSIDVPPVVKTIIAVDDIDEGLREAGLGRGVKAVLMAVRDGRWGLVKMHTSLVAISDEFYADDAKKAPGEEVPKHRKGELKKPAHEVRYWWLHAAHPAARVAMRVCWKEGVTPKGGRSFTFEHALCADPLGLPTEFFASYEPSANDLRQEKDEPAWAFNQRATKIRADAERRDREYNLGQSWLNRRPTFTAGKEFDAWLKEACTIVESVREKEAA